ncbi:MAG: Coenzyme F420 hydrogenase/dehydrogenase, beta subunit C-terminal domain [Lachnospiraceae bacterium]|nr:Coenzyme F420 hydrogenase/dehydrogenase, beta subunit C-terminal domain [Lachnospiraceae bacterium]
MSEAKNISSVKRESCTGCGACMKSCPRNEIVFEDDEEGFPSPKILAEACVDCGLCRQVCPAITVPEKHGIQKAYAIQLTDPDALKKSTSGGFFTALSREIFARGGVVYGCVWDEKYNAVIRRAENEAETEPMRGSKYVWSWAGDTYPEIKKELESGRTVLFTGLSCQVAGLKNYLRKSYDNLYTVGFLCGGSPSPYAFREYLKTITKNVPLDALDLKFRDKDAGGVGVHITYNTSKRRKCQTYISNPYYYAFYTKVTVRRSCFDCPYRYEQRVDDITFGDYWEVEKYHSEFDVSAGVSAVLVNTEKGAELFDALKSQLAFSEAKCRKIAAANNLTLGEARKVFKVPGFRDDFFSVMREQGWTKASKKYLRNKKRFVLWIKTKTPKRLWAGMKRLRKTIAGKD